MTVSDADISNALLISTCDGTYPESEEILKTNLNASALRPSLQLIQKARHRIEADIRRLSQNSSSDVDGWITQARKLQEDIERSKAVAREIVKEYEQSQDYSARVEDAKAKLELLQNETLFNQVVTVSLEDTWSMDRDLNDAESTLATGKVIELAANLKQLSLRCGRLRHSYAKQINSDRLSRIETAVVGSLTTATESMVEYQKAGGQQRVMVDRGNHELLGVPLQHLLDALVKLDALDGPLRIATRTFQRRICHPLLSRSLDAVTCSIDEKSHCLTLSSAGKKKDAQNVLQCVSTALVFLHDHFPTRLNSAIGASLSEELVSTLIADWLNPSVPLSLPDLLHSYNIQTSVKELADLSLSYQIPGYKELTAWLDRIPQTWLDQRRTAALDAVRRTLKRQRGPNKLVQRVERQNISRQDEAFEQNSGDDWNSSWTDEEPDPTIPGKNAATKDEEDLRGWDFDEDPRTNGSTVPASTKGSGDVEESSDVWEWDDENADETNPDDAKSQTRGAAVLPVNGSPGHREVTLTETYTITDIPDQLIDIISRELQDAEKIKSPRYTAFKSISASARLLSLPTLILAMFRATSTAYYTSTIPSGNMHLYNDCVYAVEKLRELAKGTSVAHLLDDCDVLEKFGRSAYAREMDIQRTVLGDLLDGAQGFVNCTRFPYSAECENAVNSTIDRVRALHQEWSSILSRSALLQSIGSLLSSVIEKIVKDIEDMEDISETESQRLTVFCGKFSALDDLFMSDRPAAGERADAEAMPLTAVYVSNWLRFQYLSNILESSLADIKYLWMDGELSLEFTADEVIELIEALFAESSYRRNAIAEIRRSRP